MGAHLGTHGVLIPRKAPWVAWEVCTAEIKLGTFPKKGGMVSGEASEGHCSPPDSPLGG